MNERMKAFFAAHSWRYSCTVRRFLRYWLTAFSILWTFTGFAGYFFTRNNQPFKPNVWLVLAIGVLAAVWMARPRLTRSVRIGDKDIVLRIDVNDMFDAKDSSFIVPANCCFAHEHIDGDSVIVQLRNRFFPGPGRFDRALADALRDEPYEETTVGGKPAKKYAIGTVAQLPLPGESARMAYIVATTELNEHGRGTPDFVHLQTALEKLWAQIAQKGNTKPLVIPVMGSGRQRLAQNRFELIGHIAKTFIASIRHRKFTERLTIVIHPRSYRAHRYNLDDIETYVACAGKYGL
ncbi:hypothetical protein SD70_01965 [Gordoniibacillus kamchatkensis]|uniref:Thoeris protein ThsA Macro domain-containing protein n=1 Tax=Gordoniibacillus kamchatkensis TaxID=1590651 RepID=A0ABR5AMW8_9BACL|nr:macro domain-containing protein [Paenibacillus sp. VKM B-2647]KIL42305.1 hypothetical protein SD70_01965 [Paenibacillus sp. VKM B-2647]